MNLIETHKVIFASMIATILLIVAAVIAQHYFNVNVQQLCGGAIGGQWAGTGIQALHNTSVLNNPNNSIGTNPALMQPGSLPPSPGLPPPPPPPHV